MIYKHEHISSNNAELDVRIKREIGAKVWDIQTIVERYKTKRHFGFDDVQNVVSNESSLIEKRQFERRTERNEKLAKMI